jgi:tRNA threonylcarbamoyladenosine biosynthesis protein TsaB
VNLLAIDTSSQYSAIGVQIGESRMENVSLSGRSHSRNILPNIMKLVQEAGVKLSDLDAIVFGKGPGSFTGLRITVGVVQGLGFGLQIPVIPVSTLACLAQGEFRESGTSSILVALSARQQEVYFGAYRIEDKIPFLIGLEAVVEASDIPVQEYRDWVGVGDGWSLVKQIESAIGTSVSRVNLEVCPKPEDLLDIGLAKLTRGETIAAMDARPEYLREQVANLPSR